MKRFIVLAAVAALVIAVPLTHDAFAAKEAKVFVCHLNSSNTPATNEFDGYSYEYYYEYMTGYEYEYENEYSGTETWWFGNVIEVAESAVPAHVNHGDSTSYYLVADYPGHIDYVSSWDQYDAEYADEGGGDYYPYYYYYYKYSYSYDYTNGEVKNADCFFYTLEYN